MENTATKGNGKVAGLIEGERRWWKRVDACFPPFGEGAHLTAIQAAAARSDAAVRRLRLGR